MEWLRRARSVFSFLVTLAVFPVFAIPFHAYYAPAAWLRPERSLALGSAFMKRITRAFFWGLGLGGARFRRSGSIPTDRPVLVVANHQSLIDILTLNVLCSPFVPAFVTRARYQRFIPLVSACIRLIGCPIVDPKKDARGSVETVRRAAADLRHGMLIFPEGHRSRDGEVRPFRARGLEAILATRRLPVYLVASDGLWKARRLVDFAFNIHHLDSDAEVLGPFDPPESEPERQVFIEGLREKLVERIGQIRGRTRGA